MSVVLNAFGEPAVKTDVFGAYEFLSEGEKYVKKKQLDHWVDEMGLGFDKKEKGALFKALDIKKARCFEFKEFEKVYEDQNSWSPELQRFFPPLLSQEFIYSTENKCRMTGPEITKLLKDIKGKWQQRIKALAEFVIKYSDPEDTTPGEFDGEFKKLKKGFGLQLKDRRSAVSRAATLALGKLAQRRPREMAKWSGKIIEVLFECVRIKIEVINVSANHCLRAFVKNVPDPKKRLPIFTELCKEAQELFVDSRVMAWELITIKTDHYIERKKEIPAPIWKKLREVLTHQKYGIKDADGTVRKLAFGILARAEMLKTPGAQEIVDKLIGVPRTAYRENKAELQKAGALCAHLGGKLPELKTMTTATGVVEEEPPDTGAYFRAPDLRPDTSTRKAATLTSSLQQLNDEPEPDLEDPFADTRETTPLETKAEEEEEEDESDDVLDDAVFEAMRPTKNAIRQSFLRLGAKLNKRSSKVEDAMIRKTMAMIRTAEESGVDQATVEAYLGKKGIPAPLIQEGYVEYLEVNNMHEKVFTKRPLGFSIVMAKKNAIVTKVQSRELKGSIDIGSKIIAVNQTRVDSSGYERCMRLLQKAKLPITIRFKRRRRKKDKNLVRVTEENKDREADDWDDRGIESTKQDMLEAMRGMMANEKSRKPRDYRAAGVMHKANRAR